MQMRDNYRPTAGEFDGMHDWERTLWLSHSYLEASLHLCAGMASGDFTTQYSSSRVVLHLARHGIELFLKGALLAAGTHPATHGHHLVRLYGAYRSTYSAKEFDFRVPTWFAVDEEDDLFQDSLDAFHTTLDQRHRYASSTRGEGFAQPEEFDPASARAELEELDRSLKIIAWAELRPKLNAVVQQPGCQESGFQITNGGRR